MSRGFSPSLHLGFGRRLPVVLQAEAAECGMACLAMILGWHGRAIDLGTMRQRHALSLKGMTLRHLVDLAGRMDLTARALRVEIEDLAVLQTPCILHWGLNHFVVLQSVRGHRVTIHDPARGCRRLSLEEVSREFTGVALELTPTTDFVKAKAQRAMRLRDLFVNVKGIGAALVRILLLSLGIELVAILLPIASQIIVDEVIVNADLDLLLVVGAGMTLLLAIQLALGVVRTWAVMLTGATLSYQWSGGLFDHLSRLPLDFFEKRHVGDVISRFSALATIEKALTTDMMQAVLDGIMSVLMIVMLVVYGGSLTLVVVAFTAALVVLRILAFRGYRDATEEVIVAEARQESHFIETVRGMASVKLLNLRERRRGTWMNQFVAATNARLRLQRADLIFGRAGDLVHGAAHLVLLVCGARAVIQHSMSFGMLVAFLAYADQFAQRAGALVQSAFNLRMLDVQAERLADIVRAAPEVAGTAADEAAIALPAIGAPRGALAISKLAFRYGADEPWVFSNLTAAVKPGSCFAIVGPSGCGKTTLMKVMMGLMAASEGCVCLDGRDIRTMGGEGYRRRIAGVMQNDGLFAGSIAENIACFDERPDPGWIRACAERAAIVTDIERMPMGFETLVGDMGSTLSGGQKQRVVLARALYRRPDILFLDEATSHLDEATEAKIAEALQGLDMTRIVIAHRPATIASADEALTLGAPHTFAPARRIDTQEKHDRRSVSATYGMIVSEARLGGKARGELSPSVTTHGSRRLVRPPIAKPTVHLQDEACGGHKIRRSVRPKHWRQTAARPSRWCPGEDSNLHGFHHWYLKPARLPIPPPGQRALLTRRAAALSMRWRPARVTPCRPR